MVKIRIENVVASTSLGRELDLHAISLVLEGAEHNPERFPGLIYRLKEPKTASLLFRSGKVVCTGAKSLADVKTAISKVVQKLEAAGVHIKIEPEIEVQNIVASSDLECKINLNAIAISLGRRSSTSQSSSPGSSIGSTLRRSSSFCSDQESSSALAPGRLRMSKSR